MYMYICMEGIFHLNPFFYVVITVQISWWLQSNMQELNDMRKASWTANKTTLQLTKNVRKESVFFKKSSAFLKYGKVLMHGEIDPLSKNNKKALIVLCSATAKSYVGKC